MGSIRICKMQFILLKNIIVTVFNKFEELVLL